MIKRIYHLKSIKWLLSLGGALLLVLTIQMWSCQQNNKVDFNAEIRPILNSKCMRCHGGVTNKGGVSFLFREEALKVGDSGNPIVVPGNPGESELIARLTHHDPDERMPQDAEPLKDEEIAVFRKWIKQGAEWKDHWAYIKPEKQELPSISQKYWIQNDIDYFILAKIEEAGLKPSLEADRKRLIRRVSMDLIGLPPTLADVKAFVEDESEDAYEKVVDQLLASPHFGERWAAMWLDLARYADTQGYEKDPHRSIWKFRDWIIKAFNEDMPYDQFTIEQLAGDLLPNPAEAQLIATAFHRNTMNNTEGGTEDEEYRIVSAIDRVNTTWTVWQGTTMECVQCHSHPYDPFKQEEYYNFFDFYNQSLDADLDSEIPFLESFTPEKDSAIKATIAKIIAEIPQKTIDKEASTVEQIKQTLYPWILVGDCDDFQDVEINGNWTAQNWARNPNNIPQKNFWFKYGQLDLSKIDAVSYKYRANGDQGALELRMDSLNGQVLHRIDLPHKDGKWEHIKAPIKAKGMHDLYLIPVNKKINAPEGRINLHYLYLHEKGIESISPEMPEVYNELIKLRQKAIRTPIMHEKNSGRQTYLFERGNWAVKGKEIHEADVPKALPAFPESSPKNRLGMAKWLVSPENPLTARVAVNRFWEQLFGLGIVETTEDFGTQGIKPSHPGLLDHLAVRFSNDLKWSVKALLKEMVMSATYRQSSHMRPELQKRDPQNRLWARGPRIRLTAEQLRDQALAVSGLLSRKMHGPSVMPPQPEGIWQVVYSGEKWVESEGADKHRRGLYTYWRRTSPYPSMTTFDSPSREFCVSRRIRTNTPLQALVTLNDPVYIEAANALAEQMLSKSQNVTEQLSYGYQLALLREPHSQALAILKTLYEDALRHYQESTGDIMIEKVANTGQDEIQQLTALAVVANVILNLDSFIMKE